MVKNEVTSERVKLNEKSITRKKNVATEIEMKGTTQTKKKKNTKR